MSSTDLERRRAEESKTVDALSRALRHFGALELDGGALCQAWMPRLTADGQTVLQTKGLPFSVVGPGDMLALFRCLSCKYSFSLDRQQSALMGAPGRVFATGEAETSDSIQLSSTSFYNRAEEAKTCQITSTVLLPVFSDPGRSQAVAVLEITQFKGSRTSYQAVFNWSRTFLEEGADLFLPRHLESSTFEMQSHAHALNFSRPGGAAFGGLFDGIGEPGADPRACGRVQNLHSVSVPMYLGKRGRPAESVAMAEVLPRTSAEQELGGPLLDVQERQHSNSPGGAASGNTKTDDELPRQGLEDLEGLEGNDVSPGKSLLRKEDLSAHFGYSLMEAAERLGVSRTTLKRACRRYGIARWPRRALLKAASQSDLGVEAPTHSGLDGATASQSQPQKLRRISSEQIELGSYKPDPIDELLEMERGGFSPELDHSGSELSFDTLPQKRQQDMRGSAALPGPGQQQPARNLEDNLAVSHQERGPGAVGSLDYFIRNGAMQGDEGLDFSAPGDCSIVHAHADDSFVRQLAETSFQRHPEMNADILAHVSHHPNPSPEAASLPGLSGPPATWPTGPPAQDAFPWGQSFA